MDEEILEVNMLPPWMELDILYSFKFSHKTKTEKQHEIKMKDCLEIIEKNKKQKSKEKGYSFKINSGDRIYHFMAETDISRKK